MNKRKPKHKYKFQSRHQDARPYLSLYAQDGLPLKLILDSGQAFEVISNGQQHDIVINYTVIEKKRKKRPKPGDIDYCFTTDPALSSSEKQEIMDAFDHAMEKED